jgi:hypothetical protein
MQQEQPGKPEGFSWVFRCGDLYPEYVQLLTGFCGCREGIDDATLVNAMSIGKESKWWNET